MNITQPAKDMLLESIKENAAQGIRFYFAGQGCCGPQFGLSMDAPEQGDVIKEINGIQVALDERVSTMVEEVSLDFKDGGLVLEGLPESNC